ncbi:hypothetical protein [Cohnella sp. WQ 127256]|uniref:hypothetical protein n=1 Tax=Cohnella sp. WQ 127256 TaxID=2938790 RepID=UPI002741E6BA|nr:hypothetical protein [Cohnella sp. WQ 127256]
MMPDFLPESFGLILIFFVIIAIVLFVVHIAICVWAYRDASRKGYSTEFALLILVALLFFPVIGLIIYLIIRNEGGSTSGRYR